MAIEVKNNNPVEAIRDLLRSMLDKGLVSAVLVPQETPSKKTVVQTLVRDSSKLETVNPLAPVFGVNSARIIAKMCVALMSAAPVESAMAEQPEEEQVEKPKQAEVDDNTKEQAEQAKTDDDTKEQAEEQASEDKEGQADEVAGEPQSATEKPSAAGEEQSAASPIALVLRPCEIRALVELVKLQQVDLSPFLVISVDCWGTYSVQDYAAKVKEGSGDSVTSDFLKQVASGNLPDELRGACRVCQYPVVTYADIVIQLIGEDINKQISLGAVTEKGKELLVALGLEAAAESQGRKDAVDKLKEAKKKSVEHDQVDFLEAISSLCINCHNCRAVCPICYCKQCVFDGDVFKYPLEKYLTWSGKKGVLPMPPDKLLFHLTRMSHVATSCVACGQCEAACPNDIPLGRIYQKISAAAQEALGYEAGRSLDDELPLTTFREDELSVVEN